VTRRIITPPGYPDLPGAYAPAIEVSGAARTLYISGTVPVDAAGKTPADFDGQCRLVWANIEAILAAADMDFDNLVKVTTYLADRQYNLENRAIRQELLGERLFALTVILPAIFDEAWLIEIEAIAVAP
jgi:enamine deaminase RidA (YjgF/YER057c/UK114 family)